MKGICLSICWIQTFLYFVNVVFFLSFTICTTMVFDLSNPYLTSIFFGWGWGDRAPSLSQVELSLTSLPLLVLDSQGLHFFSCKVGIRGMEKIQ